MIEKVILANLTLSEEFARKTIPFLKSEYFHDQVDKTLFNLIDDYSKKYNKFPSKEALGIELTHRDNLSEDNFKKCTDFVESMELDDTDFDWLVDQTEKFCQDKAIYNAIMKSIQVLAAQKVTIGHRSSCVCTSCGEKKMATKYAKSICNPEK